MSIFILKLVKSYWLWLLAAALPMVLFGVLYFNYLEENTFFWVCIITLPLSAQRSANFKGIHTFWITITLGFISILLPTTTGIYLLLCLTLVMLLQYLVGSLHVTLLIHVLLASPFFTYFNSLVSFPIRLLLSKIVTSILRTIGTDVQIEGNLVYFNDATFLVDEACAGMSMLSYGLVFGTIIIAQLSKNKRVSLQWITLLYTILLGLIFLGNIVRIALLILFEIMPEHWLHETVGFFIYAFQILFPFYLISKWILEKKTVHQSLYTKQPSIFPVTKYALLFAVFVVIILRHQLQSQSDELSTTIEVSGFTSEKVKGGVTKLKNKDALIYIKPPVSPYRSDHNPMICWQGSGYSFKKIDKWNLKDIQINHAELIKDKDKIYTAWWFQSQYHTTGDQLEWRKYGLLKNEDFYLINVACNTKEELLNQVNKLLNQNYILHNSIALNHEK